MKLLDNRMFKPPCSLFSRMRQPKRNLFQFPRHLTVFLFQSLGRLVGILQFAQFRLDFIPITNHILGRRAIFAVQPAKQIQSAFHAFGFFAVIIHILTQIAQIARCVLHFVAKAIQPRVNRLIPRVQRGNRFQRVDALAKHLHRGRAAFHAVAEQRAGLVKRRHDLSRVAIKDLLAFQLFFFARRQMRAPQLF